MLRHELQLRIVSSLQSAQRYLQYICKVTSIQNYLEFVRDAASCVSLTPNFTKSWIELNHEIIEWSKLDDYLFCEIIYIFALHLDLWLFVWNSNKDSWEKFDPYFNVTDKCHELNILRLKIICSNKMRIEKSYEIIKIII